MNPRVATDSVGARQPALVSVVVAAFNAADYIDEALGSALAQQGVEVEIIVVDDGSTDTTASAVPLLAQRDQRVRYVYQENRNQAVARNNGVKQSSAQLLAFLDADDLWEPYKLKLQIDALDTHKVSVVFADANHFTSGEQTLLPADLFGVYSDRLMGPAFTEMLFRRNAIPLSSVLMTRSAFDSVGGFEEDQRFKGCEDWELWLRLAHRGHEFFGMRQKLVRYRSHGGQTSQRTGRMAAAALAVRERYLPATGASRQAQLLRRNVQRDRVRLALLKGNYVEAVRHTSQLLNVARFGLTGFGSFLKQLWTVLRFARQRRSCTDERL